MSEELTLEATSSGEHEKKSDWVNLYSQHFVRSRCGRNLGKTRENWYYHVPLFSDTGSLSISRPVTGSKDKGASFGNSEIQRAVSSRNKNANKDLDWTLFFEFLFYWMWCLATLTTTYLAITRHIFKQEKKTRNTINNWIKLNKRTGERVIDITAYARAQGMF